MASAARSRTNSLAPAGLVGMALLQHAKSLIEEAYHDLELTMVGRLDLITEKQIALRKDVKTITESFADRLIAMKDNVDHLARSRASICSELEIP